MRCRYTDGTLDFYGSINNPVLIVEKLVIK